MNRLLNTHGTPQMVAIVDPHIKKADDFRVYKDARDQEIITKKNDKSNNFEGWCWTGSSVWVDFFNPKSWSWWNDMFSFKVWTVSGTGCRRFGLARMLIAIVWLMAGFY